MSTKRPGVRHFCIFWGVWLDNLHRAHKRYNTIFFKVKLPKVTNQSTKYNFVMIVHSYLKSTFSRIFSHYKCCEINLPNSNVSCPGVTFCGIDSQCITQNLYLTHKIHCLIIPWPLVMIQLESTKLEATLSTVTFIIRFADEIQKLYSNSDSWILKHAEKWFTGVTRVLFTGLIMVLCEPTHLCQSWSDQLSLI